jgi:hypothetical protein
MSRWLFWPITLLCLGVAVGIFVWGGWGFLSDLSALSPTAGRVVGGLLTVVGCLVGVAIHHDRIIERLDRRVAELEHLTKRLRPD